MDRRKKHELSDRRVELRLHVGWEDRIYLGANLGMERVTKSNLVPVTPLLFAGSGPRYVRVSFTARQARRACQAMTHEPDRVLVRRLVFGGLRIKNASPCSGPMSILSGRHSPCVRALPTSAGD